MAIYGFFECTRSTCRLRFPLDTSSHQGLFCPLCGGVLRAIPASAEADSPSPAPAPPGRRIIGILDNIRSAFNVGGIFRTADGAGVEHLFLCGITPTPSQQPSLVKTALGAEKAVPWSTHPNALTVLEKMRDEGFGILALERTVGSVPIQEFSLGAMEDRPLGLIVGHERAGVDPGLLEYCDGLIALPMVGRKASLNAAVAFGVAAYWLAFIQAPGV